MERTLGVSLGGLRYGLEGLGAEEGVKLVCPETEGVGEPGLLRQEPEVGVLAPEVLDGPGIAGGVPLFEERLTTVDQRPTFDDDILIKREHRLGRRVVVVGLPKESLGVPLTVRGLIGGFGDGAYGWPPYCTVKENLWSLKGY